ncbi:hypothetical protein QSJ19_02235 [Gordonia sp. ABSL11-1]|uniref:hypothetical protein n=1 Tax=Gordonia sp. ABSL11-1 TaxID=3053924 RepID=UPI002573CCFF|nr:hypothetical protein [Gordonia sp. ABSL11-1]MDL9944421.1 hypothetical protein [Gordonia sp. ABSL11-1]
MTVVTAQIPPMDDRTIENPGGPDNAAAHRSSGDDGRAAGSMTGATPGDQLWL